MKEKIEKALIDLASQQEIQILYGCARGCS
jgi:hypothetical protein